MYTSHSELKPTNTFRLWNWRARVQPGFQNTTIRTVYSEISGMFSDILMRESEIQVCQKKDVENQAFHARRYIDYNHLQGGIFNQQPRSKHSGWHTLRYSLLHGFSSACVWHMLSKAKRFKSNLRDCFWCETLCHASELQVHSVHEKLPLNWECPKALLETYICDC